MREARTKSKNEKLENVSALFLSQRQTATFILLTFACQSLSLLFVDRNARQNASTATTNDRRVKTATDARESRMMERTVRETRSSAAICNFNCQRGDTFSHRIQSIKLSNIQTFKESINQQQNPERGEEISPESRASRVSWRLYGSLASRSSLAAPNLLLRRRFSSASDCRLPDATIQPLSVVTAS